MNQHHLFPHAQCRHFASDFQVGFKLTSLQKGETSRENDTKFHNMIFILEGELLVSYDDFINRNFQKGDMLFIPQASNRYGEALKDSRMLILAFNSQVESLCDTCSISQLANHAPPTEYDFTALRMTEHMWKFVRLMESYISKNISCAYLHKTKQCELFVLLQHCYTKEQILKLFHPAIGLFNFKSWVLENYQPQLSITELAKKQNMTTKSFSRRFKKEFQDNFRHWALNQKAKHIKHRLSIPGTTFSDIIRDFNFSDLRCFYNFCKEQYGCTATELMAQIRQQTV